MYFLAYDTEGNYDLNLYAVSVEAPGAITLVGRVPQDNKRAQPLTV